MTYDDEIAAVRASAARAGLAKIEEIRVYLRAKGLSEDAGNHVVALFWDFVKMINTLNDVSVDIVNEKHKR